MKKLLSLAVIVAFLLAMVPAQAAESKTIVFIPKATLTTFYLFLRKGAVDKGRELGYEIEYLGVPTEADVMGQVNLFNDVAKRKPAGILCAAIDANAMQPAVKAAMDAGVPVVMVDATITDTTIPIANITADNYQGGQLGGEQLAKLLNYKGKVANLGISAGSHTGLQRSEGFIDTIAKYKDMTVLPVQWTEADPARCLNVTTDLLNGNPDLAGVYGAAAAMGVGASQALKARGKEKEVKIVHFDPSPEVLPLFEQGLIQCIISQDPYQMGYRGVDVIDRFVKGQKIAESEKNVQIPTVAITPENYNSPDIQRLLQTPDKF
ncbi:MAG: substrate-binding domain-containing protein [Planctomycetota bacterium]|jgi:ribose transport system substrate-binding protein|nr:substrate-binding domain-containing protein [Planctomycetota bacterium]